MKQSLTLIKLGGAIITNKEVPMAVQETVLQRIIRELAQALKKTSQPMIVGHGQGSFAHAPAMRYKTMDGFIREDSAIGMAITQDSAAQLNRVVVHECIKQHLPAVSYLMSNALVTKKRQPHVWHPEVLEEYLAKGMLPITGGDVIVDVQQGCTIWSTEEVLGFLAEYFLQSRIYQVKRVIHVTETAGVLDENGLTVPEVSKKNAEYVKSLMTRTKGFDVTGGMWHKISECLDLAEHGIESTIISGLDAQSLYDCIVNNTCKGTRIV